MLHMQLLIHLTSCHDLRVRICGVYINMMKPKLQRIEGVSGREEIVI